MDAPVIHNGKHTLVNEETGEWRTFEIKTMPKDSSFAPGQRVIALLAGPDNEGDYVGFGFVSDDGIAVWRKKRSTGAKPSNWEHYARMVWLANRDGLPGYVLETEGRCLVCNRTLTTPESIRTGIGPICGGR